MSRSAGSSEDTGGVRGGAIREAGVSREGFSPALNHPNSQVETRLTGIFMGLSIRSYPPLPPTLRFAPTHTHTALQTPPPSFQGRMDQTRYHQQLETAYFGSGSFGFSPRRPYGRTSLGTYGFPGGCIGLHTSKCAPGENYCRSKPRFEPSMCIR